MRISIANISSKVTTAEFSATVHAVGRQVNQDFAPLWGMDADVRGIAMNRNTKPNPELSVSDVILYVGELDDDPQKVADAIGYHDLNNKATPYGFIFTDVVAKVRENWSTTLPTVNVPCAGPAPPCRLPPGYLQTPASPQACASAFCVLATSWLVTKALIASV